MTFQTLSEEEDKTRSALLLNVVLNTFLFALPVLFANTILMGRVHDSKGFWSSLYSPG
jgi:hypothetical protein